MVYLIDFGLARRIGNKTMALSSMYGGTFGFMAPELYRGEVPTKASDLYSLGATLICLITQTKSVKIGSLMDEYNKFVFKDKVTQFSLRFVQWLEKIVAYNPANRYQNAEVALDVLKPLDLIRIPEVNLDRLELNFVADKVNQKLVQTITVTNKAPDTILQGNWSVSPHPKDPPHTPDSHSWISFSPRTFEGNKVDCRVTVDTSKLKSSSNFEREIVLDSNAKQENYYGKVKLKTAPIQYNINTRSIDFPPYISLTVYGLVLAIISWVLGHGWLWIINHSDHLWIIRVIYVAIFLVVFGIISLIPFYGDTFYWDEWYKSYVVRFWAVIGGIIGAIVVTYGSITDTSGLSRCY